MEPYLPTMIILDNFLSKNYNFNLECGGQNNVLELKILE